MQESLAARKAAWISAFVFFGCCVLCLLALLIIQLWRFGGRSLNTKPTAVRVVLCLAACMELAHYAKTWKMNVIDQVIQLDGFQLPLIYHLVALNLLCCAFTIFVAILLETLNNNVLRLLATPSDYVGSGRHRIKNRGQGLVVRLAVFYCFFCLVLCIFTAATAGLPSVYDGRFYKAVAIWYCGNSMAMIVLSAAFIYYSKLLTRQLRVPGQHSAAGNAELNPSSPSTGSQLRTVNFAIFSAFCCSLVLVLGGKNWYKYAWGIDKGPNNPNNSSDIWGSTLAGEFLFSMLPEGLLGAVMVGLTHYHRRQQFFNESSHQTTPFLSAAHATNTGSAMHTRSRLDRQNPFF